jgi:hypothetical protein
MVEILFAISILLLVFASLFAAFQSATLFETRNRLFTNARLIASERAEEIRSLPFDEVGTVLGIPSGSIPQTETQEREGVVYTIRTFVQFVDDEADGLDEEDTLPADYKRAKVEVSFPYRGVTQYFSLVLTIAPKSQESLEGAGVLRIIVSDAHNVPVPHASVRVINSNVSPAVDVSTFTNEQGVVSFPGAWEGAGYEISVSKAGFSSTQTYVRDANNPNPNPGHVTVVENTTSEVRFAIDRVSSLAVHTILFPESSSFTDDFVDATKLATSSHLIADGTLHLEESAGVYSPSGDADSETIVSTNLAEWLLLTFSATTPADTSARVQVLCEESGVFVPVPDTLLSGNSAGFSHSPIRLDTLAMTSCPQIRLRALLATSNTTRTPEIQSWRITYEKQPVIVPSVSLAVAGGKTKGTDAGGLPIPKYTHTGTTDTSGILTLSSLEWDGYSLTPSGQTLADACPTLPFDLAPNTDGVSMLFLAPAVSDSLTVHAVNAGGVPQARVVIDAQKSGVVITRTTNACGVAYFPLSSGEYTLTTYTQSGTTNSFTVPVSGATQETLTL